MNYFTGNTSQKNFGLYLQFRCADVQRGTAKGVKMKHREKIYVYPHNTLIYFFRGWMVQESNPGK